MKSSWYRKLEYVGVGIFILQFIFLSYFVIQFKDVSWLTLITTVILALISADFISGLVHWFADTCGDESWPLVGPNLILPFRLHHLDPSSILKHDFIETNGSLFLLTNLTLAAGLLSASHIFQIYFLVFSTFVAFTNQIHKYAHAHSIPWFVQFLTTGHLILSKKHHSQHHDQHQTKAYCITTGWLNIVFDRTHFFRVLESFFRINS